MNRLLSLLKQFSVELLLAGLFFVAAAYYYNGANKNHISRFDLVFSFVEPETADTFSFRINRFIRDPMQGINTVDWAQNPGHDQSFYSNKAPGPALLGIPVYAAIYWLERACNIWPEAPGMTIANCYAVNLVVTVLPVSLSLVCFYWLLLPVFAGQRRWPIILTVTLYFGTLMLPYSTQFWGHTTAAAFIVIGLYLLQMESRKALFFSGLLFGLGVLCEYSVAITVLLLIPFLLCRKQQFGSGFREKAIAGLKTEGRNLTWFILGGLPMLIIFMAYHLVCFGSPFTIANFHNNPVFKTAEAAGGLFQLSNLWVAFSGLLFSTYRGLFPHMPALVAIVAVIPVIHRLWRKPLFWLAALNILGFLLMNVTFNGWHGGDCLGPRYQIPVLPFYVLLIALSIRELQQAGPSHKKVGYGLAAVFTALLLLSISNMFVATAVSPLAEKKRPSHDARARKVWDRPLYCYYTLFRKGIVKPHSLVPIRFEPETPRIRALRSFDLGEFMGLRRWHTSIPFLVVYVLGLGGLAFLAIKEPRPHPESSGDTKQDSPKDPA